MLDRLLPGSLAGRTTFTLLAGLLMFHLGSVWLLQQGVHGAVEDGRVEQVAERLAATRRTLSALPEEVRETAARALSSPTLDITWLRGPPEDALDEATLAPLRNRLERLAPQLGGLRVGYAAMASEGRRVQGGVPLSDGTWAAFASPVLEDTVSTPTHSSLASLSAMAIGIVLASILVVRWITNPLRRLVEAAEGFGKGGAPVLMPEDGPREVREAARTFNAMQARIHRLIADRTQALAAVSHDLRTPIQRLRLRAGFLEDAETQSAIDADLDEMESMVEATLAYLRGEAEAEEPRPADLAAILRTLCDDAADRGDAVTYGGPDRVPLRLRPVAVKRAFANLIDNAMKYGGGARVTLENEPEAATVRVEDDGPGIPDGALETVFEPFHRLEESRNRSTGGTGLGLTIARQVVQGHGGTLTLANRPVGGLAAVVRLPRTEGSRGEGGS
jgi:signal transduction histidine kinase